MASLIDLRGTYKPSHPDDVMLRAYVGQLIGEPFLFARVSYGNEFSMHFGTPRPMRSKFGSRTKGSYILGLRGSAWQLKSGTMAALIDAGIADPLGLTAYQRLITVTELEQVPFVQPGARVVFTDPFIARPTGGYGLLIAFSDNSVVVAVPTPVEHPDTSDEGAPERIPYIADWELFTPHGMYLWVGPEWRWGYETSTRAEPQRTEPAQPVAPPPETSPPARASRRKPKQERE